MKTTLLTVVRNSKFTLTLIACYGFCYTQLPAPGGEIWAQMFSVLAWTSVYCTSRHRFDSDRAALQRHIDTVNAARERRALKEAIARGFIYGDLLEDERLAGLYAHCLVENMVLAEGKKA